MQIIPTAAWPVQHRITLAVAVLLFGCEPPPTPPKPVSLMPPTTTEEKRAAIQEYHLCLEIRARSVDDHTSDAMTVARAIQGSCRPEMLEYATAMTGGLPTSSYYDMAQTLMGMELESSIKAVLAERRGG
jgi:hypothetical protein